jgi:dipeptidyl-peptidase III
MTGKYMIGGESDKDKIEIKADDDFLYFVEQFEDMRILKYKLPGFENLQFNQKLYIYYLGQAALCGRDILWDQNFRYNLKIRKTIEAIICSYQGEKRSSEYYSFLTWARRVFFANGIHHHYSRDKMVPGFTIDYFTTLITETPAEKLPISQGQAKDELIDQLVPVIFDEGLFARKVVQSEGSDMVAESATNFYFGVNQKEVEDFYYAMLDVEDPHPVSLGLNSRLIKAGGELREEIYCSGGKYGQAIDKVIEWLVKAQSVCETAQQKNELDLLIGYYKSGDLRTWDEFNVAWVRNHDQMVDFTNGFIETYEDPLGMKATWEAIVHYTDQEGTSRTKIITANSQWFEDHSPVDNKYRKEKVTGVAAKVINIAMLGGDCYPVSPLGINLPNADWIRKEIGSKSVTLGNITAAHNITALGSGFLEEFAADNEEIERVRKYENIADVLHTDLHECIGHASGKLAEGTDPNALKNYYSPLEEARADLFALYFIMDPMIIQLGLLPEKVAAEAEYDSYMRNGLLTQLSRIRPGRDIEEAHMRCRALISNWVHEHGKDERAVEYIRKKDRTYVKINDYVKVRSLFGILLKEIQRIKSEGDYEAGKSLVENYGVKVDKTLHDEVLKRYSGLNLAPYTGFVNPYLLPVLNDKGQITDIRVEYTDDYLGQMICYGNTYSFLPFE